MMYDQLVNNLTVVSLILGGTLFLHYVAQNQIKSLKESIDNKLRSMEDDIKQIRQDVIGLKISEAQNSVWAQMAIRYMPKDHHEADND